MRKTIDRPVIAFLTCLLLAAPCPPAAAQAKPPDTAAKAEAEKVSKEGEKLLAQHDAARGADAFFKAYNLSHNIKFLLPLGMAYAEAERPLDALDALGRYLKEAQALPDAKRKEIGGKLQVMLDQVAAVVTIEANRQNAPVKVDGRQIGLTPIEGPVRLLPGRHEILLQPAPTDPSSGAKVVIDVRPGERKAVKLEPGPRSRFLEPQSHNDEPAQPTFATAAEKSSAVAQAPRVQAHPAPIYKKWWFWTGVGAAAVLTVGLAAGLGTHGSGGTSTAGEVTGAPTWNGGVIDARGGTP